MQHCIQEAEGTMQEPPQQPPTQPPTFLSQSGPLFSPQPQRIVPPPRKGEPMNFKRWWETASNAARAGLVGSFAAFFCACCSLGVVAANGGNHTTTPQIAQATSTATSAPASTPTPKPTATPKPTNTPDPNAGFGDYVAIVTTDSHMVGGDLTTVGNDCGSGDISLCRSDAQTLSDDIHKFQADLDAHAAPPCLKTVDDNLRNALRLYDHGAQSVMTGIDTNDASLISSATADFNQATSYINLATTGIKNAHC